MNSPTFDSGNTDERTANSPKKLSISCKNWGTTYSRIVDIFGKTRYSVLVYTRIKLEQADGTEFRIEAGLTSFPQNPWRVKVVAGTTPDDRSMIENEQYATQEELYDFVDRYVKERMAKGCKVVMYKADGLDIDWLGGIGVSDQDDG